MKKKSLMILILSSLITIILSMLLSSTIHVAEATGISDTEELESGKYIVNNTDKIIYRVMPETTVSDFKEGFRNPDLIKVYTLNVTEETDEDESESSDVSVETKEEVPDDSIVTTGMILENTINNEDYEISVIGDFDGNGSISQVELTRLIRAVIGLEGYQLTGIYEKSGDLNNDNNLDHIDVTILIRYLVYGELDIDSNTEVKSPKIEIVDGKTGLNDWYVSNLKLKVTPDPESIDQTVRTTYKIIGSKTTDEIEINSDEIITLEDGEYQIIAYSYNAEGYKSIATRREFKVDATAPTIGKLNMWLDEENGEPYEANTWTNRNVVISSEDGTDETSGHAKTSYYIKDSEEVTEGTQGVTTLSESGTYIAVLKTEDNAGNVTEEEYTIRIDNSSIIPPELSVLSGDKNPESEWYHSDVVLQLEQQAQAPNSSKIVKNTYEIEGAQNVPETEIEDKGQIKITENGTCLIKVYSYNEAGDKSVATTLRIKKDNTVPAAPQINVISGTQQNNNWYIEDVKLQVIQTEVEESLSPITRLAYKIEGANETALADIDNEGTIDITTDGISTISVYNYNEAGTRSDAAQIIIQKDSQNPQNVEVRYDNLKSDSYTLICNGADSTSGMASYDIYIDDVIKGSVEAGEGEGEVRYDVTEQTSGSYKVYIVGKDKAGRSTKSSDINIKMAKLENDKIDHVEFVINNFNITDEENRLTTKGVSKIVSDTSLTSASKYIMLTSDDQEKNNLTGLIVGKVRIILKNGNVVEDKDFFPEDLVIDMGYYTNGSGKNFAHENEVKFFGNNLNPDGAGDKVSVDTSIDFSKITENKFSIKEKKTSGIQTSVRTTIKSVSLGKEKINFQIIDK